MTRRLFRTIWAVIGCVVLVECTSGGRAAPATPAPADSAAATVTRPATFPVAVGAPTAMPACCHRVGLAVAERYREERITKRVFTHADLWQALEPHVGGRVAAEVLGRSIQGRPIRALTFGAGPTTVLLWSQMHGDESTATMALADLVRFFAAGSVDDTAAAALRDRLHRALTVVMIPMLNPDGAERFQRENAAGIDINRDARRLATPEARLLDAARARWRPAFGFNLHDQGFRTLAGAAGAQTGIALLAPPFDSSGTYNAVRQRARAVAALIAATLTPELPRRLAGYDDTFNPRAFGDLMQQAGVSTVLIESGVDPTGDEKQRLRALNVVALLTALDAIAVADLGRVGTMAYDTLPANRAADADLLIVGGQLAADTARIRADVAVTFDDPRGRNGPRIREIGDLAGYVALDTIDASGMIVHVSGDADLLIATREWILRGRPAILTLRRGGETVRVIR